MRLHSIEVQGLWSYRDIVSVELDGMPLVVAVGQNGTGKSALVVSSVLVALYGKFPTRTVEDSISSGMPRGSVTVEFSVGLNRYRVSRTYQRTGSATASLFVQRDGDWAALTEKGVREVTTKVAEILGMPFETATMTWVAEQGAYGKFATAQPSERFKLLAGVYGLNKYTPLLKTAREHLRAADDRAAQLEGRVIELTDGLVDDDADTKEGLAALSDPDLAAKAAAERAALDEASAALAAHRQSSPATAVRKAEESLAAVRDARLAQLAAAERALESAREARAIAQQRRDDAVTGATSSYTSGTTALQARTRSAISDLNARIEDAEETLNSLEGSSKRLPELRAAVDAAVSEGKAANAAIESVRERRVEAARAIERHASEASGLRERIAEGEAALSELHAAGDCQHCGQHLSESLVAQLRSAQEQVIAGYRTALADTESAVDTLSADETSAENDLTELEGEHEDRREALARLRGAIARAEGDIVRIDTLRAELTLNRQRVVELDDEGRTELAHLSEAHEVTVASAEAALVTELADIKARGEQAAISVNTCRTPNAAESALTRDLESAQEAAAADDSHVETETRLSTVRDEARERAAALDAEVGRRAEVSRRATEQAGRIEKAKTEHEVAKKAAKVHADLVAAYSPSGIPSMVLESVIDELSSAVNTVLTDLSGGELAVRISTTRETSSGAQEPRVTVYIETGTGTRPYEGLSGGQRFRVDLAIRMGLAAVVAAGTGTPIETFILDEGWGTLDEEGIRSTLAVLHRLSEQVNVLTVSHIDSVRDAFPARIEVTATEGTAEAIVVSS